MRLARLPIKHSITQNLKIYFHFTKNQIGQLFMNDDYTLLIYPMEITKTIKQRIPIKSKISRQIQLSIKNFKKLWCRPNIPRDFCGKCIARGEIHQRLRKRKIVS